MLTRARFLRLGATATLGTLAAPVGARAALPAPTPQGDDEGFLQFGALTERTALVYYRRALRVRGFDARDRARLRAIAADKVVHVQRLTAALGADAPSVSDYAVDLPASAFATRAGALKLGRRLEGLLCGVYVGAVAFTADPATRLLLGRHPDQRRDAPGGRPRPRRPRARRRPARSHRPRDGRRPARLLPEGQRLPHPLMRRLLICLCLLAPAAVPAGAQALNVSAAASLRNVLPRLSSSPDYNFAGSNALQRQIERGAPRRRVPLGRARPRPRRSSTRACCSRPVTFATNIVVLLVPNSNPGHVRSVYSLRSGGPPDLDRHRGGADRRLHAAAAAPPAPVERALARTPSARSPTSPASPRRSRSGRPTRASSTTPMRWPRAGAPTRSACPSTPSPPCATRPAPSAGAAPTRAARRASSASCAAAGAGPPCTTSASGCRPAGDPPRRLRRAPSPCARASRWRSSASRSSPSSRRCRSGACRTCSPSRWSATRSW